MLKYATLFPMLALCFFGACSGQPTDQVLGQSFHHPTFVAPDPAVQKLLRIPFLDGDLYGICNYEGKIIVQPQFEDVEMPMRDLPIFKAKMGGIWSLFDFEGNQIASGTEKMGRMLHFDLEMINTGAENDIFYYRYISKIQDPRPGYLPALPGTEAASPSSAQVVAEPKPVPASRYFFLTKNSKKPYQSWFSANNQALYPSPDARYRNGKFTSGYYHGYLKVMDEKRYCTLLDTNGNALFPPVLNCATVAPDQILIINENGLCALRDLKKGWQTEFLFQDVEPTANPNLFLGNAPGKDKTQYFKIDATGKVQPLADRDAWIPMDERYSRVGIREGEHTTHFVLFDEKTGKNVRELPNHRIETIFQTGFAIYAGSKYIGIQTVAGDTIWMPPFDRFTPVGDSLYIFVDGADMGLADRRNRELFRFPGGTISKWGKGIFQIEKDKKMGLVAPDGRILLPPEFDQIQLQRDVNRCIASKNELWGYFETTTGREILPVQFKDLQPNGFTAGRGSGIEIREGGSFYVLTANLEIVMQESKNPMVPKSDFEIKNAPAAVAADFNNVELPRLFTPFFTFDGLSWLHIFRCDGKYITSLEGLTKSEPVFSFNYKVAEGVVNAVQTGLAKATDQRGKSVWIRLEDGLVYRKK